MRKLGSILVTSLTVLVVAFFVFRILFNLEENFRLVTSGTVTQGIIFGSWSCHKYYSSPVAVQFTDFQGRMQEAAVADGCGSIGIPFRQAGDHVTIVYLRDTPTIARIQGDLVLQFWMLEVPILLVLLFVLYLLGRFWGKRMLAGGVRTRG